MKDPKKGNHIPTWTGAAFGITGTGVGLLISPELAAPILGILSSAIGQSGATYALQTYKNYGFVPEDLIAAKAIKDFSLSRLSEHNQLIDTRENSKTRIEILSKNRGVDYSRFTPNREHKWLRRVHREVLRDSYSKRIPKKYYEAAERLNNHSVNVKRIAVSCESIEPACVAVLKSLSHENRFHLELDIDYEDFCGVYQVQNVDALEGEIDFLVAPNAPFFMNILDFKRLQDYRLNFEIHGEQQVLLTRSSFLLNKMKKIHVFGNSTAEEEILVDPHLRKEDIFNGKEIVDHKLYEDIVSILDGLDRGEAVIAWEPLASVQATRMGVNCSDTAFLNWISLFSHKRWLSPSLLNLSKDFRMLFLFEWMRCHRDREWPVSLLLEDSRLIDRFSIGAGLDRPM